MSAKIGDTHIGLIVEGRGDQGAVPVLLRRHLYELEEFRDILGSPVNVKGVGNVLRSGGIEGFVGAVGNRPGCVGVLVIVDGDGSPVCQLGPELFARIESACECPVVVALADCDFEDWLFASAETLDLDLKWSPDRRGSSEISSALRPKAYTKPVDQPKLAHKVDIGLARGRSHSFNRLLERFEGLLGLLT